MLNCVTFGNNISCFGKPNELPLQIMLTCPFKATKSEFNRINVGRQTDRQTVIDGWMDI